MHIHFLGIGGVAMGPLARLARDAGHDVSGSDKQRSRYTDSIDGEGILVQIPSSAENLAVVHREHPIDWLVYTAAMPIESEELRYAQQKRIPASKRDELINQIIKEKHLKLIAVSGTHGKTNTTGMLVWAFKQLGIPVSWLIGSNITFGANGHYDPQSEYLVYEADEFDRNFLSFYPEESVIPSVDYDHPETYSSVDEYKRAFREFVNQSKRTYLWEETKQYLEVESDRILEVAYPTTRSSDLKLPGRMTRRNAGLVANLLETVFSKERSEVLSALASFPGTERRMEQVAHGIISDYAHHPTEIRAAVQAAREMNERVVAVYQPHQNRRQRHLLNEYKDCFAGIEKVLWLPTYLSREPATDIMPPEQLIGALSRPEVAEIADMNDDLRVAIDRYRADGALILLMSAGDLDDWVRCQWL